MDKMLNEVSEVLVGDSEAAALVTELSELQLLLVGGGIGDIIVA